MKNKRIILDTNLWISFLITKNFSQLDELIENKSIVLVFSDELINEFIDVASRPKFKKFFINKEIAQILEYFDEYGVLVKVKSKIEICRDEKDNFLLSLAADSKADYLITGDLDLLVIKKIARTKILSFTDFMEDIQNRKSK